MENNSSNETVSLDKKENKNGKQPMTVEKFIRDLADMLEYSIIFIFIIMMIMTYIMHPVSVKGNSMYPTLENTDGVLMTTFNFSYSTGDIVVLDNDRVNMINDETGEAFVDSFEPMHECIIKRVIAAGGQTVGVDPETGKVTVDGVVIDEPYLNEEVYNVGNLFSLPLEIPEGYYFVMGDNRNHSTDSRSPYVGLIDEDQIYGKVYVRYDPVSKIKFV